MNPLVTEARALCEAATFGPWKTHEKAEMSEVWDNDAWAKGFGPLALVGSQPEDAAFIARSRTLLPEMAAEIERLEAERDRFKARAEALMSDLARAKPCFCCKHRFTDDCLLEESMDACSDYVEGGKWEWRGPQEGANT